MLLNLFIDFSILTTVTLGLLLCFKKQMVNRKMADDIGTGAQNVALYDLKIIKYFYRKGKGQVKSSLKMSKNQASSAYGV